MYITMRFYASNSISKSPRRARAAGAGLIFLTEYSSVRLGAHGHYGGMACLPLCHTGSDRGAAPTATGS
jgi:hypothetical protein